MPTRENRCFETHLAPIGLWALGSPDHSQVLLWGLPLPGGEPESPESISRRMRRGLEARFQTRRRGDAETRSTVRDAPLSHRGTGGDRAVEGYVSRDPLAIVGTRRSSEAFGVWEKKRRPTLCNRESIDPRRKGVAAALSPDFPEEEEGIRVPPARGGSLQEEARVAPRDDRRASTVEGPLRREGSPQPSLEPGDPRRSRRFSGRS